MRTFLCHRCNKQFTVDNPNWTTAVCPHCSTNHQLPNYISKEPNAGKAVGAIMSIIMIILGMLVLMN